MFTRKSVHGRSGDAGEGSGPSLKLTNVREDCSRMFVLQRAGRWFAQLFEAFDNALVALDDDLDALAS